MTTVEILNKSIQKPYLGGWRHKVTGVKYFNAESQTGPPFKKVPWHRMCSRLVQAAETEGQSVQTGCDLATQMWRFALPN